MIELLAKNFTVGFCGVDDNTDFRQLEVICQKYQYIEFGIVINDFTCKPAIFEKLKRYHQISWVAHCSESATQYCLDNKSLSFLNEIPWARIQLNIDWSRNECNEALLSKFTEMRKHSLNHQRFIIPENYKIREKLKQLPILDFIDIISDVSGGKGVTPDHTNCWSAPYAKRFGYAGGIRLDNLEHSIEYLKHLINQPIEHAWIDMQSSVIDKGSFSTKKVLEILECFEHQLSLTTVH